MICSFMRSLSRLVLVSAFLLLLAGVVVPAARAQGDVARQVLDRINQARAGANLPALARNGELEAAAQGHANDLLQNGARLGHVGSDGSSYRQRIARAGYPAEIVGENWASYRTLDQAIDFWLTDPPHRRNILSDKYREIGIGVAVRGNGGFVIVADFGARSSNAEMGAAEPATAPTRVRPTRSPTRAKPKPTAVPPTRKPAPKPTTAPTPRANPTPTIVQVAVSQPPAPAEPIALKVRGKFPRLTLQGTASAEPARGEAPSDGKRESFGGILMLSGALLVVLGALGHRRHTAHW